MSRPLESIQRREQLPRMHDLLGPASTKQPESLPTVLPTPYNASSHYAGGHDLAHYRSVSQSHRPDTRVHNYSDVPFATSHAPSPRPSMQAHSLHSDMEIAPALGQHARFNPPATISSRYEAPAERYYYQRPLQDSESTPQTVRIPYTHAEPSASSPRLPTGPSSARQGHLFADVETSRPPHEDARRSRTTSDASVVPHWGYTKAGKLRKRLEQACANCRRKKTKCEPLESSPKCAPCEKSGIECHFDNVPRPGHKAFDAPLPNRSHDNRDSTSDYTSEQPDSANSSRRDGRSALSSVSSSRSSMGIEHLLSPTPSNDAHPLETNRPHKRPRHGLVTDGVAQLSSPTDSNQGSRAAPCVRSTDTLEGLSGEVDPYELYPDMTEHYLRRYLDTINIASYCIFPRERFLEWVRSDRKKLEAEKMLLYAMLALGSVFSDGPASMRNADGRRFAVIAEQAVSRSVGIFSLALVQTRLILALLKFAQGHGTQAWDYCGGAVRAACGMKLNLEKGVQNLPEGERLDFDLDRATLVECRRRTFWATFLLDRYNGFCSGHDCLLQGDNCLLRLPCDDASYAHGDIPTTPFFASAIIDPKKSKHADRAGVGLMAHLVEVAAIWGDILSHAYRSEYMSPEEHGLPAELFYQEQMRRLATWKAGLPAVLHATTANVDEALQRGYIGSFTSLWLVYHCAAIRLCRHARLEHLSPAQTTRNIREARHHACKIVELMTSLARGERQRRMPENSFTVSTPFIGYGVLSAIDVLTSAGSVADLKTLLWMLKSAVDVMEELALYWASAERQSKMVSERVQNLVKTLREEEALGDTDKKAFFAREAVEVTSALEHDLIYDAPLMKRLEAVGIGDIEMLQTDPIEIKSHPTGKLVAGLGL